MPLDRIVPSSDGFPLSARVHGDLATAHAGVVISPAMGVPQSYYAEFADWLAAQGFAVMSFDYRGMGASRPPTHARSLRGFEADVVTWAERDAASALDYLAESLDEFGAPGRPVHWIGHSLGGQIVGLMPEASRERLGRIVTVGCGSGYWRENSPQLKRVAWALWYFIAPVAMAVAGYFPGRRIGKVGDLPLGVMTQWRRWCLSPDYLMGEGGDAWASRYSRIANPILSLSFTDDEFMSARNIESLHGFYAGAPREMRRIAPQDVGARAIGHFGFFRPRFQQSLWPQVVPFLQAA